MLFRPDSDWTISSLSIMSYPNNNGDADDDDGDNLVTIIPKWWPFSLIFVCFGFNNKSTLINKSRSFTRA